MNPLKLIDAAYLAQERDPQPVATVRASQIGDGVRKLVMLHTDTPRIPLTARAKRVFERGDTAHDRLRRRLVEGAKDAAWTNRVPVTKDTEEEWSLTLTKTWKLTGHPDGVLPWVQHQGRRYNGGVLLEIKTAGQFAWATVTAGKPTSFGYLAQAQINMYALGLQWALFLYERKDTQALHQFIIAYDQEIAELLLAKAEAVAKLVDQDVDPLLLDQCEGVDYGWVNKRRKLGEKHAVNRVLEWGCSYCPFWQTCHPTAVQVAASTGTVVTIDQSQVPDDSLVLDYGHDVDIHPTWNLGEER